MEKASERELVAVLREALGAPAAGVTLGIGDDAAILAASPHPTVLSVDASIEGVHFERRFAPLPVLAARAFTAAVSDLAAMAAAPRAALVSLVLPDADLSVVRALAEGLAEGARRYGCPVVGGNLARGRELQIHTTVVGAQLRPALTRAGARAGDDLWVTGNLGGAHVGLTALATGATDARLAVFVERWRRPAARLDAADVLSGRAHAAMDLSDGLAADAPRLADASEVRLAIDLELLPRAAGLAEAAAVLGLDPLACAWSGGEDYELLFAAAPAHREALGVLATRIGRVEAGRGVDLSRGGEPAAAGGGFDHFRARA